MIAVQHFGNNHRAGTEGVSYVGRMTSPGFTPPQHARSAVFLNKNSMLIENARDNVDPARVGLRVGVTEALVPLDAADFQIALISNERGIAFGVFPESALGSVWERIRALLSNIGVPLAGCFYCPHHPNGSVPRYARTCSCRKPAPGLLYTGAQLLGVDLQTSWVIGDTLDDIEAGARAGCHTIFLNDGGETEWFLGTYRMPEYIVATLAEGVETLLRHTAAAHRD